MNVTTEDEEVFVVDHKTQTGRLSGTGPRMINLPHSSAGRARNRYAPAHGYSLVTPDYHLLERQILAQISGTRDPLLAPLLDPHDSPTRAPRVSGGRRLLEWERHCADWSELAEHGVRSARPRRPRTQDLRIPERRIHAPWKETRRNQCIHPRQCVLHFLRESLMRIVRGKSVRPDRLLEDALAGMPSNLSRYERAERLLALRLPSLRAYLADLT
jgi:hypothetical protein